ncbi:hypothetical protein EV363DRAFT_1402246 [Boletus edulis]|nr:hypothetical protein EV363DRAFT_1402246 [Boletus edulis]
MTESETPDGPHVCLSPITVRVIGRPVRFPPRKRCRTDLERSAHEMMRTETTQPVLSAERRYEFLGFCDIEHKMREGHKSIQVRDPRSVDTVPGRASRTCARCYDRNRGGRRTVTSSAIQSLVTRDNESQSVNLGVRQRAWRRAWRTNEYTDDRQSDAVNIYTQTPSHVGACSAMFSCSVFEKWPGGDAGSARKRTLVHGDR